VNAEEIGFGMSASGIHLGIAAGDTFRPTGIAGLASEAYANGELVELGIAQLGHSRFNLGKAHALSVKRKNGLAQDSRVVPG